MKTNKKISLLFLLLMVLSAAFASVASAKSIVEDEADGFRAYIAPVEGEATPVEDKEEGFESQDLICAAKVSILEVKQTSTNVRVGFNWTTFGATSVNAKVELFNSSNVSVYNSGSFALSPVASGSQYFLITPQNIPSGTYRVRVTITTNCFASSQDERFVQYVALSPVVACNSATTTNSALYGEQCLSFVPNGSGGYTLSHYAITDGDPLATNLQHPFLGVSCRTSKNGVMIEQYEVEHILGSQQGNIVEYGATNGSFYQTGVTPIGNYFTLPTNVPSEGATYTRTCQHWAGYNFQETNVSVFVP